MPNDEMNSQEELEMPKLKEPESITEILQHINIISDAINKCERILQHLAIGNFTEDFDKYMSKHIDLIGRRNNLRKKLHQFEREKPDDKFSDLKKRS